MFLKPMVAVMAASMRALRLFERSIARPLQHQFLNADQDRATRIPLDANVKVELLMMKIRQQRQLRGALLPL
jgi:hypothetical protein